MPPITLYKIQSIKSGHWGLYAETESHYSDWSGSNLSNQNLVGLDLRGAKFRNSNFSQANLSDANLAGADFSNCNLERANFSGADLVGANFRNANLEVADFRYSQIRGCSFDGATMTGSIGSHANARDSSFRRVNLKGSRWCYANFTHAKFIDAQMPACDFTGSTMQAVDFSGVGDLETLILTEVNFSGAILDSPIYTASRIGPEDQLINYLPALDVVWCTGFQGSLKDWQTEMLKTSTDETTRLQYEIVMKYFTCLKDLGPLIKQPRFRTIYR